MSPSESANLSWLEAQLGLPLAVSDEAAVEGSVLGSRLDQFGNLDSMVMAGAQSLRAMHDITVSRAEAAELGISHGWEPLAEAIEKRIVAGLVDSSELPEPYRRYSPERLLEIWTAGRSDGEQAVLCHGQPTLANVFVDTAVPATVTSWIDRGTWRFVDRHHDLAIIHHDVHRMLGPEAVFIFYDAYGMDPNLVSLDHHLLGNLLLGQSMDIES